MGLESVYGVLTVLRLSDSHTSSTCEDNSGTFSSTFLIKVSKITESREASGAGAPDA